MRRLAVLLLAMGVAGCADTVVERDRDGNGYTLSLAADVIYTRPMLWRQAADESAELCPNGYKLVDAEDMPSDVAWRIRCLVPVVIHSP